jgi:hypothetical protein
MKTSTSETIVSVFGTMMFLFFLVPFFIIWIPYEILQASGNDIVLRNGVFQYVGLVFIALGFLHIFGVQAVLCLRLRERQYL